MKTVEKIINALIVLSVITFSISTLPDLTALQTKILNIIEYITIGVFTVEYLANVTFRENQWGFIFSRESLIDLTAIVPFFMTGIDLRVVRILRMVKLMKIPKFKRGFDKFAHLIADTKDEFILFFTLAGVLIFISSTGIYFFEHKAQPEAFGSVFHALWWAIVTLTTVGYGDVYPVTLGGKIFTTLILLIGLGVVAIPTGLITSSLSKLKDQ